MTVRFGLRKFFHHNYFRASERDFYAETFRNVKLSHDVVSNPVYFFRYSCAKLLAIALLNY